LVENKEQVLGKIKELENKIKTSFRVKNIGLFGSYIKDKQDDKSDLDFLVEFEDNADLLHFIGLSLFLEDVFRKKVDVVSKNALKEELRERILQEVIYE